MEGALVELSRQLLRCADGSLLDLPLDVYCDRVASEEVRELVVSLHEAGTADRVRDLLEDDLLARWARERCTLREEELLCEELQRWLGVRASGPDDPERLVALPEPPDEVGALTAWAELYEVVPLLALRASTWFGAGAADTTVVELCTGSAPPARGSSLLARDGQAREARARLWSEAAAKRALIERVRLHEQRPPAALSTLARRLRARCDEFELADLHRVRFVPARPCSLELDRSLARAALQGEERPLEAVLYLSGYEHRALDARCGCARDRCEHVAALAARLFDATLDPSDRLHGALLEFVAIPSWQRFVAALSPPAASARASTVVFAVRREGESIAVGALTRRRGEIGAKSPGKLGSPRALARSSDLSDRDRELLSLLAARTRTLAPQFVAADLSLLRALCGHGAVELHPERLPLAVREESVRVLFEEQPEGVVPRLELAGRPLRLSDAEARRERDGFVARVEGTTLSFAAFTPALARFARALETFRGVLPKESYPAVASLVGELAASAEVALPRALEGFELAPPERLLLRVTPLFDRGIDVSVTVRALPLAPLWSPGEGPELVHGVIDGVHRSVRRRLVEERERAEQIIETLELKSHVALGRYAYRIEGTEAALGVLATAARLREDLEIEWAERARSLTIAGTVQRGALKVELFKRGDFLSLEGGANVADRRVPLERLLEAARNGERFVRIEGSTYAEIESELFERLERAQLGMFPSLREIRALLSAERYLRTELETLAPGDPETAAWLARVSDGDGDGIALPELALPLRAYQREGARFLLRASQIGPGACLADEMGLGKTLQTIAVLAARRELGPQLVIAPTSVVEGWLRELRRAAPELEPSRYLGAKRRALLEQLGPNRVLVASYDVVQRDRDTLATHSFATVVVDEAQWLKNARTRRARAVAAIPAGFRVALSGTPIENRLADLWSLFQLIAPGLLGSWSLFRARFAVPIERYENSERSRALRELVRPLLLRRKKHEVASELPARTEVVHTIELTPAERDLYSAALEHARRALGKRKRADDTSRTVRILAELTRLRQLACHPRLVIDDSRVSSSKMRALLTLLRDILPRGHRVLVFSQFVRHLALLREELERAGLSYLYLDGAVPQRDRVAAIDAFQAGEAALFLISLKAGGAGLNLTAADYVIHLDPWWNPAAEDQASDRAHRIGQHKPVTVVRLVAQGTIEQRVLALHEHKRKLAADVIEAEGASESGVDASAVEALWARECEAGRTSEQR